MSARISARLDPDAQARLERMQRQTGKSVTQIVTEAIDLYDQRLRAESGAVGKRLLALAGIMDGPATLSGQVKEELADMLDEKFPDHR